MKAALIALLFVAVTILIVSATQPLNCAAVTCSPGSCGHVECACGMHKDECGCCDICYKCPGDQCHSWILDQCATGAFLKTPPSTSSLATKDAARLRTTRRPHTLRKFVACNGYLNVFFLLPF
ncbi:uncharacterized protein LOC119452938 isoform X1 [Dermacentor silvarum]|uniref:uncharacterized protein LOC119452938 isoform X1 n=1 Tax=Dermacentor silvarum TaxID=543639 RepID=UPI002101B74C|nr:uncharacterized protein LOC119452938 isoform X1 [Dermacentor silvarum]